MYAALRATLALVCLLPLGTAQQPTIAVASPRTVLELDPGYRISITGEGFYATTPDIVVYDDGVDITSQVTVGLTSESIVDQNGDGVAESYSGDFTITFGSYDTTPGNLIVSQAVANSPSGQVNGQAASRLRSNLTVTADSIVFWGETDLYVALETEQAQVGSLTFEVLLGTTDVTSLVSITADPNTFEVLDNNFTPPLVRYRLQGYSVDVSALGAFTDTLTFLATASASGGGSTAGSTSSLPAGSPGGGLTQCHKDALESFMTALQLSGTSGGDISVGASSEDTQAAADGLQAALAECEDPFPGKANYTSASGRKLHIVIGGTGKDAKTGSQSADVVVAIGGDAAATSSSSGGNATAVNTQAGGAAVAIGGSGGSGAGSGGNGGNGSASAKPGSSGMTGAGQATGIGGMGGTPSPTTGFGGNGGSGEAKVGGVSSGQQAGSAGSAGKHGGGGYVQLTGSIGFWGPFTN